MCCVGKTIFILYQVGTLQPRCFDSIFHMTRVHFSLLVNDTTLLKLWGNMSCMWQQYYCRWHRLIIFRPRTKELPALASLQMKPYWKPRVLPCRSAYERESSGEDNVFVARKNYRLSHVCRRHNDAFRMQEQTKAWSPTLLALFVLPVVFFVLAILNLTHHLLHALYIQLVSSHQCMKLTLYDAVSL